MEEKDNNSLIHKKKHRHRKKQLHASIRKQMEFYFSDASLSKDRFLHQLIAKDPFIPIDIFLTFNKIKTLTDKSSDLVKALVNSTVLELSDDKTKLKRIKPLLQYDVDSRTIYVESIPSSADIKWLIEIFQVHGPVAYVSLPKYHKTKRIKGFAFVEFENPEDAEKCLKAFTVMGCKLPTTIKPDELSSIQSFQNEMSENETKLENSANQNETSNDDAHESSIDMEPPSKKIRIQTDEENLSVKENNSICRDENVAESEGASEVENSVIPEEIEKKSKPSKKRKKRNKKKQLKEANNSADNVVKSLQVLSKREWKALRNKYLNMQKKHMEVLKRALRTQHTLPENRGSILQNTFAESEQTNDDKTSKPEPKPIPFVEGVIVNARLAEPCVNVKELKKATKANIHVKYIDVKEGSTDVYIRMDDNSQAKLFTSSGIFPEARILDGEEEKLYWEELRRQQTGQVSSKRKMRGRDRLIKKAEQIVASSTSTTQTAKHTVFDD